MAQGQTRPDKARQGQTRPDKAAQGQTRPRIRTSFASWDLYWLWRKARQGQTRPDKARQGQTRPDKARQGRASRDKAAQAETRPDTHTPKQHRAQPRTQKRQPMALLFSTLPPSDRRLLLCTSSPLIISIPDVVVRACIVYQGVGSCRIAKNLYRELLLSWYHGPHDDATVRYHEPPAVASSPQ